MASYRYERDIQPGDLKPRREKQYTRKERWANWWDYNLKWVILIGIAVNAAIPPVNAWLVDAYPEGTITGSVFLSSFTTKVAVYALIRIFAGTDFLMAAGCFMALYGALYAIMENDMRRRFERILGAKSDV